VWNKVRKEVKLANNLYSAGINNCIRAHDSPRACTRQLTPKGEMVHPSYRSPMSLPRQQQMTVLSVSK